MTPQIVKLMEWSTKIEVYDFTLFGTCFSSNDALSIVRIMLHNYIKNDDPPVPSQSLVGWAACKYTKAR